MAGKVKWEEMGESSWSKNCYLMFAVPPPSPPPQGVITVKGLVDREKGDFYTLTVVADDGGPKVDSTVVSGSWVRAPLNCNPSLAQILPST